MKEDIDAVLYIYEKMRTNADKELKSINNEETEIKKSLSDIGHLLEFSGSTSEIEKGLLLKKKENHSRIDDIFRLRKKLILVSRMKEIGISENLNLSKEDSDIAANYRFDLLLEKAKGLLGECRNHYKNFSKFKIIINELERIQGEIFSYNEFLLEQLQEKKEAIKSIITEKSEKIGKFPKSFINSSEIHSYCERIKEDINDYMNQISLKISESDKLLNTIDRIFGYIEKNEEIIPVSDLEIEVRERRRKLKDTMQLLRPFDKNLEPHIYRSFFNEPDKYLQNNKLEIQNFQNALSESKQESIGDIYEILEKHAATLEIGNEFLKIIQDIKNLDLKVRSNFSPDAGVSIIREIYEKKGHQNYIEKTVLEFIKDFENIINLDSESFTRLSLMSYIALSSIRESYLKAEKKIISEDETLKNRKYNPKSQELKILWA
jgi:hypothetical protein